MKPFNLWRSHRDGQWYWRLRARNGRTLAHSEGYTRRARALQGIRAAARAIGAVRSLVAAVDGL